MYIFLEGVALKFSREEKERFELIYFFCFPKKGFTLSGRGDA